MLLKDFFGRDYKYYFPAKEIRDEVKLLQKKNQELTNIFKKRTHQLFKAREQIKDLKTDKNELHVKLLVNRTKTLEMEKDYTESVFQLNAQVSIPFLAM